MFSSSAFLGPVQFAPAFRLTRPPSHVLFDFDGTLSLIREGWPQVMTPMFVELLPALPGESEKRRRQICWDDIMRLNGKQTIYQMIQLAERIKERGGHPRDPLWYKHEYLRRLDERIHSRREAIRRKEKQADDFLVHEARAFLDELHRRGLPLYLASGTDENFVRIEAELLGLNRYFGTHIYGA
jgi:phosphoglycolate phosphatase